MTSNDHHHEHEDRIVRREGAGILPGCRSSRCNGGTYEDIVKGSEGQYRVRLMDNTLDADCGYSGVETLPDGTFVATSYGHWTEGKPAYIVSIRLKLDELEPWVTPKTASNL